LLECVYEYIGMFDNMFECMHVIIYEWMNLGIYVSMFLYVCMHVELCMYARMCFCVFV